MCCVAYKGRRRGYLYANEEVRKQLGNYLNLGTKFSTCNDLRINGQGQATSVNPPPPKWRFTKYREDEVCLG